MFPINESLAALHPRRIYCEVCRHSSRRTVVKSVYDHFRGGSQRVVRNSTLVVDVAVAQRHIDFVTSKGYRTISALVLRFSGRYRWFANCRADLSLKARTLGGFYRATRYKGARRESGLSLKAGLGWHLEWSARILRYLTSCGRRVLKPVFGTLPALLKNARCDIGDRQDHS